MLDIWTKIYKRSQVWESEWQNLSLAEVIQKQVGDKIVEKPVQFAKVCNCGTLLLQCFIRNHSYCNHHDERIIVVIGPSAMYRSVITTVFAIIECNSITFIV